MQIKDLSSFLESIAPLHLQEPYDNAGLITGQPDWEIKGVLFSLDATPEVINEAKALGCNLVVSHHPIIFNGLKRLNGNHYVEQSVIHAIKNDIALYAIHTNLDNVLYNGVNSKIAQKLGLTHLSIMAPKSESETTGAGIIGFWDRPMNYEESVELVKKALNIKILKATPNLGKPIQKVAICGGSGAFLTKIAIQQAADLFISSDFKYHEFFESNNQIVIFDVGHYESEQFTIELLYTLIREKFCNFASHCTKINTNPVQFL